MAYRTDLAVEIKNDLEEENGLEKSVQKKHGISIISIKIKTKKTAKKLQKPIGNYITLQHRAILEPQNLEYAENILAQQLERFVGNKKNILFVGLGNREITSDSLGPLVANKIVVTRHLDEELKEIFGFKDIKTVSAICPGVFGRTGMESTEIVKSCCIITKPDLVIAVDSLAAGSVFRLGTTIQLTDTGICPGSGVCNKRKELSHGVLGVDVLAIGVPTVVDMKNINKKKKESIKENMTLTPKNIDQIVKRSANLIANSLNRALFPTIKKEELKAFYD